MIDDALGALSRILRRRSASDGHRHADEWEIPRKALREAIANAVVHREYGRYFLGWPVSVDVYPEKVVVSSPGGLWGGKTVDGMDDGTSRCRNARLMQLMESTSLASDGGCVAHGCGSGVAAMLDEMDAHALARPEFDASPDLFQVTFERPALSGARSSARTLPYRQDALFADGADDKVREEPPAPVAALDDAYVEAERSDRAAAAEWAAGIAEKAAARAAAEQPAASQARPPRAKAAARIDDAPAASAAASGASEQDAPAAVRPGKESIEERIAALLKAAGEPLGARDIADGLGLEMPVFRYRVKKLVDAGVVAATAAPTSKKRKYVFVGDAADGDE